MDFILTELRRVAGFAAAPVCPGPLSLHFANTVVTERYRTAVGTDEGRRTLVSRYMLFRGHYSGLLAQ